MKAFFENLDKHKPDATYCLGDLVGYNLWPNEVINAIRKRQIPTIAGNYHFGIGRSSDDCGCAYKADVEKANGAVSISFTNKIVKDDGRKYLRTLPAHINVEFQLNEEKLNLLLVHGSPRKINEYLFEDRAEKSLLRIMRDANADVMCFGHTHKPYHRVLEDGENGNLTYRHAVNIGSVGKPKDGNPQACYVILHLDENTSKSLKEGLKVQFIRFEYDVEKAAKAVEESILPDAYATSLRVAQ